MLTFGTAYVYKQKETGKVVSNCHKLPENKFIVTGFCLLKKL